MLLQQLRMPLPREAAQQQRLELRRLQQQRRQEPQALPPLKVDVVREALRLPQPQVRMPDAEVPLQQLPSLRFPARRHLRRLLPRRKGRGVPVVLPQQHPEMHTLSSSAPVATSSCRSGHLDRATGLTVQRR